MDTAAALEARRYALMRRGVAPHTALAAGGSIEKPIVQRDPLIADLMLVTRVLAQLRIHGSRGTSSADKSSCLVDNRGPPSASPHESGDDSVFDDDLVELEQRLVAAEAAVNSKKQQLTTLEATHAQRMKKLKRTSDEAKLHYARCDALLHDLLRLSH